MKNITRQLQDIYVPQKALILYKSLLENEFYVESYDMDENGSPINARPLTLEESDQLASALQSSAEKHQPFLHTAGLLPDNLLYLNPGNNGCVIWHTKPRKMQLFFKPELSIPCGKAYVPPLLWKATQTDLYIFALTNSKKPTLKTTLFQAPFFNVYEDGKVCMGTVDIEMNNQLSLEQFMHRWQHYFFNSYFSHVIGGQAPVNGNIIQLWQQQMASGKKFPITVLKKQATTLKQLLP